MERYAQTEPERSGRSKYSIGTGAPVSLHSRPARVAGADESILFGKASCRPVTASMKVAWNC